MAQTRTADGSGEGMFCSAAGAVVRVRPRSTDADLRALEYTIAGDGDEPVDVTLRQPLPEGVSLDDVGFPGPCADHWDHDEAGLVLQRSVAPGETVTSGWGFETGVDPELEPPTVETVPANGAAAGSAEAEADADADADDASETAAESAGEPLTGSGGPSATADETPTALDPSATRDAAALESPSEGDDAADASLELEFPGQDGSSEAAGAADGDDEANDADDGLGGIEQAEVEAASARRTIGEHERGDAGALTAGEEERADSGGSGGVAATDGDTLAVEDVNEGDPLVHRLVAELESEDLADDDRQALRDALDARLSDSTNAFVEHLSKKLQRRTDRLEEELSAMEESVEGLYGVKADTSDVDALGQAITELDDAKVGEGELHSLADRVAAVESKSIEAERVEAVETQVADAAAELDELRDAHEELRADHEALDDSLHEAIADVEGDLRGLEDAAARERRLDAVGEELEELRETAATEDALTDLRDDLEAATAEREESIEAVQKKSRSRHNETISEIADLQDTLETEYSTDAALQEELGDRVHRSVAALALFGVGAAGLGASIPLALAGSGTAVLPFLGGLGAIGLWRHDLESEGGLVPEELPAPLDRLRS